ncbi:MAG: hypothetical protein GF398_11270 [Chitinivibrionales bacterium]|nr:hypothetical protein [Chitinivibrionales bacterium]
MTLSTAGFRMRERLHISIRFRLLMFLFSTFIAPTWPVSAREYSSDSEMTLKAAMDSAHDANAALRSDSISIAGQQARLRQAHFPENPEFALEAEDIGTSGGRFEAGTRLGWEISQSINPALRLAETRSARAEMQIAKSRYSVSKADLKFEVKSRFFECVALHKRCALADSLLEVARTAHAISLLQAEAGKTPVSDTLITAAEYALAQMQRHREHSTLANAYSDLSALWGGGDVPFRCADAWLDSLIAVPDSSLLFDNIDNTPLIRLHKAQIDGSDAAIGREKLARFPSLSAGAGVESTVGSGETFPYASLSFSIPLFNWNQGAIQAAAHRKRKAKIDLLNAGILVRNDLRATRQTALRLYEEIGLLETSVLPQYRMGYDAALLSYQAGKSDVQVLIGAQKALFEFSRELLGVTLDYVKILIELERISGLTLIE